MGEIRAPRERDGLPCEKAAIGCTVGDIYISHMVCYGLHTAEDVKQFNAPGGTAPLCKYLHLAGDENEQECCIIRLAEDITEYIDVDTRGMKCYGHQDNHPIPCEISKCGMSDTCYAATMRNLDKFRKEIETRGTGI